MTSMAQDIVVMHNGQEAVGQVIEKCKNCIKFIYDKETTLNTIGFNAIKEIRYQSGRTEQITAKIDVDPNEPKTWDNIRVVYDKDEIMGLKSLGQVEKHSSGTWSFSITAGHFSEKTLKKIRKEAGLRGGCIVLILSSQSQSGGLLNDGHASMTGEIYTY